MKIYIIGIGLIGGSFAMEMRKLFPKSTIIGIDKSENNLNKAHELSIIDKKSCLSEISDADIICLLYTSPSPRDRTRSRMPSSA